MDCRRSFAFLAGLLILALGPWAPGRAAEIRCAVCGEVLTGRYVEESGHAYHEKCYAEHRAPRCAICRKPILEARIEVQGESFHESCYRESRQPRCAACGKPIEGTYLIVGGRSYHPACRGRRATQCVVCGGALEGSYVEDGWGNPFHSRHSRELLCPFCGRVMSASTTGGSRSGASGMRVCALCARRAVSRPEEVRQALERVRRRLEGVFPVPEGSFSWELVDRKGLLAKLPAGSPPGSEMGLTRVDEVRRGGASRRKIRVFLLTGMPDWLLEGVAAHELAHVWQQLRGLEGLPADQAEGSAEYASYLLLREEGTREGEVKIEAMSRSADPAYGAGFRRALQVMGPGSPPGRLREILEKGKGWPSVP